ncbi:hypothetical protein EC973_008351 [Apophysomyces ossiformis]|uniref:Uncharacterized protein n=1 Tax=Apophysomyces ossiformis TaxID=679940 RepID=A0A8H7ER33_9FUNG|nr:hypothetical protein EC973_008351 [Apophysomyces ossiformis]
MSFQVNFNTHGADLNAAYQAVLNDNDPVNWLIYSYDKGTNDLRVQGTGDGGLEELYDEFNDGKIQFAYARVKDPNTELPKYVFVAWCGSGVPETRKGFFNSHLSEVSKFFKSFHVQINARDEADVEPDLIIKRVAESSGAKYSVHKEKARAQPAVTPVGSVYQKTEIPDIAAMQRESMKKEGPPKPVGTNYEPVQTAPKPLAARWGGVQTQDSGAVSIRAEREKAERELREREEQLARERERQERNIEEERRRQEEAEARRHAAEEAAQREREEAERQRREQAAAEARAHEEERKRLAAEEQERQRRAAEERERQQREAEERERQQREAEERERQQRETEERERQQREIEERERQRRDTEEREKQQKEAEERQRKQREAEQREKQQREAEERERQQREAEKARRQEEELMAQQQAVNAVQHQALDTTAHAQGTNGLSAVVLFGYEAAESNEMTLIEGETILQIDQVDEGWWFGVGDDGKKQGLFPANYVQILEEEEEQEPMAPPPPPPMPPVSQPTPTPKEDLGQTAIALYDYAAGEDNEISFKESEIITHIEFVSEDWWQGVGPDGTTVGLFPANYVELQH